MDDLIIIRPMGGHAVECVHRSNLAPFCEKTRENSATLHIDQLTSFEGFAQEKYVPSTSSSSSSARGPPLIFDPSPAALYVEYHQYERWSEMPSLSLDVLGLINDAYNQGYYPPLQLLNNWYECSAMPSRNDELNDSELRDSPFIHCAYNSSHSSDELSPKSPYGVCPKQQQQQQQQQQHPNVHVHANTFTNNNNSNHTSPWSSQTSRPDLSSLLSVTEDLDPQQLALLLSKAKKRRRGKTKPYESMLTKFKLKSTSKPHPHQNN